jgi:predicted benzoate:H+ symporter BenE
MTQHELPPQSAHKAWAAAAAAIIVYLLNSLFTGEWVGIESIAPAIAVILMPVSVYATRNVPKE